MIQLLIMDVDGTLTDGKIYMGNDGEVFKVFSIKDGAAIAKLPQYGITPIVITGRESQITKNRCKELGITEIYQNCKEKRKVLDEIIEKHGCSYKHIAYMGDDLIDFDCIKLCGVTGCPADAVNQIKTIVDFISNCNGGNGAVREFIDWIFLEHSNDIFHKEEH